MVGFVFSLKSSSWNSTDLLKQTSVSVEQFARSATTVNEPLAQEEPVKQHKVWMSYKSKTLCKATQKPGQLIKTAFLAWKMFNGFHVFVK